MLDNSLIEKVIEERKNLHINDPCVEKNLEQLKAKVLETGADLGLSFDGDGDRMGMVTATGRFIPTDLYMIIIIRDIINKVHKKTFLYDVKCSKALSDEIEKHGNLYYKHTINV